MRLRPVGRLLKGLADPYRPILAQLVVTRRCNLDCAYCNEYDQYSPPVAMAQLVRYVDHLAGLGTGILTLTGGEPLLHPELEAVVAHAVSHGMVCTTITNAYLLTPERIERLNRAGLYLLQVSIDNLEPNETSRKSLHSLRKRLSQLKEHARFKVNLNAVLGSVSPEETNQLVEEVRSYGFYMTVSLMHDGNGSVDPGLVEQNQLEGLFADIQAGRRRSITHRLGEGWEIEMLRAGQSDWKCRAGSRYLYIDEFGIVSYCSQRRGDPGIPLLEYGRAEIKRFFPQRKGCEPGCTIGCVRRASAFDRFRKQDSSVPSSVGTPLIVPTSQSPST